MTSPFNMEDQTAPVVPGWCKSCNVPILIANRGPNSTVVLDPTSAVPKPSIEHGRKHSYVKVVIIYDWHRCLNSEIEITSEVESG